jgi:alanine racemase
MTKMPLRYPHIAIDLDNVIHNLREIRRFAPPPKGIMAVVKDCAYGCGSVMIAKTFEQNGVSHLAVATIDEARALREAGVTLPILVFGTSTAGDLDWVFSNNIICSLNDLSDIACWKASGKALRFHCALDTGMGRLGILPHEAGQVIEALKNAPALTCDGIYTHCAQADEPGTARVSQQLKRFRDVFNLFIQNGIRPRHIHYANSAALLRFPLEPVCTLVRPGIALYGCRPDPAQDFGISLKPVASLKSHVVKIKRVPGGTPVSYGGRYVTQNDTQIATIPVGYGQGLPRVLGNKGSVLIRGRRYAIAGTVTMDYIMVDTGSVTDVTVGDEVVAVGCQGSDCITADDVGLLTGTIGYEILCGLGPRLDRYYYLDGKVVHHLPGCIC